MRLRHMARDIEIHEGRFLIGRTNECELALDDALVSRRHALLTVQPDGVFIHDLGSRNGVFLNGLKIEKPEGLRDGDQLRIGSQDMVIYGIGDDTEPSATARSRARATLQDIRLADLLEDDAEQKTSVATSPMPSVDKRVHGLALIGTVADKAFALGRADEAERLLQRSLADVLARAGRGEATPELAEEAAVYAVRLAGATGRGSWIDYAFQLYTLLRALLPARVVDELYAVIRKVKHTDKSVLRAYTNCLKEISSGFGPAERFIQQRIESFERWAP